MIASELRLAAWLARLQLSIASVFPYVVGRHRGGIWDSHNVFDILVCHVWQTAKALYMRHAVVAELETMIRRWKRRRN